MSTVVIGRGKVGGGGAELRKNRITNTESGNSNVQDRNKHLSVFVCFFNILFLCFHYFYKASFSLHDFHPFYLRPENRRSFREFICCPGVPQGSIPAPDFIFAVCQDLRHLRAT